MHGLVLQGWKERRRRLLAPNVSGRESGSGLLDKACIPPPPSPHLPLLPHSSPLSLSPDPPLHSQDDVGLLAFYQAALNEDCLKLKLCEVWMGGRVVGRQMAGAGED